MGVLSSPGAFGAALAFLVVALAFRFLVRGSPLAGDLRYSVFFLAASAVLLALRRAFPQLFVDRALTYAELFTSLFLAIGALRLFESLVLQALRKYQGVEVPRILRDLLAFVFYGMAVAAVLHATLDVNLGSLLATSAVLSVIIGLALQETLGHFFSGLALSLEKPFQVGDWITCGPNVGRVTEMTWRSTKLLTFEDDFVVVPNGAIAKDVVRNHSRPTRAHARLIDVGVVYGVAPNAVKEAIRWVLAENARVLKQPAPEVQLLSFGDFAVIYRVRFWIPDFAEYRFIEDELKSALWYKLKREKIGIPFPVRDVAVRMVSDEDARREDARRVVEAEELLGDVYFIRVLPAEVRRTLAMHSRSERFGGGETVIRQGAAGETFYLVAYGEVAVRVEGADRVAREVARLSRGEFFGEMSLLTGEPRAATVVATTDSVLLVLDRGAFAELISTDPGVAQQLSDALARRKGELDVTLATVSAEAAAAPMASGRILDRLREIFKLR